MFFFHSVICYLRTNKALLSFFYYIYLFFFNFGIFSEMFNSFQACEFRRQRYGNGDQSGSEDD